jgi:hypothetical protein
MTLGNILSRGDRCQFIDWCETYVGDPFITLQHLLLLNPIEDHSVKASIEENLKNKYRAVMRRICDAAVIEQGFVCMPLMAAASALYGRGDWLNAGDRPNPQRRTLARTIARYMDRAAREPALLQLLCA